MSEIQLQPGDRIYSVRGEEIVVQSCYDEDGDEILSTDQGNTYERREVFEEVDLDELEALLQPGDDDEPAEEVDLDELLA